MICANCGEEGNDINNTCNKCKTAKYCNAACKRNTDTNIGKSVKDWLLKNTMKNYLNNHH